MNLTDPLGLSATDGMGLPAPPAVPDCSGLSRGTTAGCAHGYIEELVHSSYGDIPSAIFDLAEAADDAVWDAVASVYDAIETGMEDLTHALPSR